MRSSEVQRVFRKYLAPSFPGYRVARKLIYRYPTAYLLHGLMVDDSDFDPRAFCVTAFVQPLYVPFEHVAFMFGGRLGALSGGQERWWTLTPQSEPDVMSEVCSLVLREGVPFLDSLATVQDVARVGLSSVHGASLEYIREAVAYAFLLSGDPVEAEALLARLEAHIVSLADPVPWLRKIGQRAALIRGLIADEPNEARQHLDQWTEQTKRALKLDE